MTHTGLTLGAINPGAILPGNGKVSLESVMPKIMSDEGPKAVKEAVRRRFPSSSTPPPLYPTRTHLLPALCKQRPCVHGVSIVHIGVGEGIIMHAST